MIAGATAPLASAQGHIGPDYVSSDNLELVDRIKTVGDGVAGAWSATTST